MSITIALDCMGGDHGVSVTVPAALEFLEQEPDVSIILVGLPEVIERELKHQRARPSDRLTVKAFTATADNFDFTAAGGDRANL